MDAGEISKRQSIALPPISPLDAEARAGVQHKRTLDGSTQASSMNSLSSSNDRLSQTNAISTPAISAQTIAAGSALASLSGITSPSDTRRLSDNNSEMRHQSKQSLPSIHEALRADLPRSYPEPTCSSQSTASYSSSLPESNIRQTNPEHHQSSRPLYEGAVNHPIPSPRLNGSGQTFATPALPPPPPPPISRSQPDGPSRPYSPNLQNGNPSARHAFSTNQSPVSTVPPPLPPPPPPPPQSLLYSSSSTRLQQPFDPSGMSQRPPQTPHRQHPYPAPPQFGNLTPASPSTTGPLTYPPNPAPPVIHQNFPPANGPAAGGLGQPHWRNEHQDGNKAQETKRNGRLEAAYGESVKRHLDLFDLEASLNEIAEGSGRMLDFTKLYGRLAYQSPRTHTLPTPMPTIAEIDDLISREGRMHESLIRIREMILAQQTVMAEQAQEPRIKGLNGSAGEDEAKSYAASANSGDPKRRKGRAAPPGRCHSCSRAETPEWRRGPDGARTLCNACGLHYAKLTRKMGQNNEAANSGSNLRPKTIGRAGSPGR